MKIRVLIQARTNSARLFGKSIRPVCGIPLAILVCLRARNAGLEVKLLTSEESSDDILVDLLTQYKIPYLRGDLQNVFDRFLRASKDLNPDDVIIRLTADNCLPDGAFLNECLEIFNNKNMEYAQTDMERIPYGMSAEIFKVKHLRASQEELTPEVMEHVTPLIRRKFPESKIFHPLWPEFKNLRCTIDTMADYSNVLAAFENVTEPEETSWKEIVKGLGTKTSVNQDKELILGGAQLGMQYGISNENVYNEEKARELFNYAYFMGFDGVDTAKAYQSSEVVIGKALAYMPNSRENFQIITKTSANLTQEGAESQILKDVSGSKSSLGVNKIDGVLFHRFTHMPYLSVLQILKKNGVINKVGVSIQNPEELLKLPDVGLDIVQLPCSLLDRRWDSEEVKLKLETMAKSTEIHVRSVFLQGILANIENFSNWPVLDIKYDPQELRSKVMGLVRDLKFKDAYRLSLAYVKSLSWCHSLVVGVGEKKELEELMEAFCSRVLNADEREYCQKVLSDVPFDLLDPSKWKGKL